MVPSSSHPGSGSSPGSNIRPAEMSVWQSTPLPVSTNTALRVSPSNSNSSHINTLGGARDGIAFAKPTSSNTATVTAELVNPSSIHISQVSSLPRNFSASSDVTATSKVSNSSLYGSNPGLNSPQVLNDGIEVRTPKSVPPEEFVFAQPTSLPPRDK